jgi:hypothetical protein
MVEQISRVLIIEGDDTRWRVDLIVAGQRVNLTDIDQVLIGAVAVLDGDLKIASASASASASAATLTGAVQKRELVRH